MRSSAASIIRSDDNVNVIVLSTYVSASTVSTYVSVSYDAIVSTYVSVSYDAIVSVRTVSYDAIATILLLPLSSISGRY